MCSRILTDHINRASITSESGPDRYRIVLSFKTLGEMQDARDVILDAIREDARQDAFIRAALSGTHYED